MKNISLTDRGQLKTRDIIRQIASAPPANSALNFEEMGRRVRILKELDRQQGDVLRLEDADWQVLSRAVDTFAFGFANADLYDICLGIKEAKETVTIHAVGKEGV